MIPHVISRLVAAMTVLLMAPACEGERSMGQTTNQDTAPPTRTMAEATSAAPTASTSTVNPFPEHPGKVTYVDEGAGERKVVAASTLSDEAKFFYVRDAQGKPVSRIPIVEVRTTMWDKAGLKVPQAKGCKGIAVIIGANGEVLQSVRLDNGCHEW